MSSSGDERFYFFNSLMGYNVGIAVTMAAMEITESPQPALLYILPTMVFFYIGGGFVRKETIKMLKYDEDFYLKQFQVKINN